MNLFKREYTDANGQKKQAPKWYLAFYDHNQILRRWAAFTDKARTQELGRKLRILIDCRISGERPDFATRQWLENLPDPLRKQMRRIGLLDSKQLAASQPLAKHLEDFRQSLHAKGNSKRYVEQIYGRLKRVMDGCGFVNWSDISASAVQNHMGKLRQNSDDGKRGISAQTFNFYLQAVKQFCKWMVQDQRATESPVEHLKGMNAATDRRHPRRAITPEEQLKLIETTWHSGRRRGMEGRDRAVLYWLAGATGYRSSELRQLMPESFDLKATPPTANLPAKATKTKREDASQPLPQPLADVLKVFLIGKLRGKPVFDSMPRRESVSKMLRLDLKAAGIPYRDKQGRVANFHALRHTYITDVAMSGMNVKIAQRLARHSDVRLTLDRYTHIERNAHAEAYGRVRVINPNFAKPRKAAGAPQRKGDAAEGTGENTAEQPEILGAPLGSL